MNNIVELMKEEIINRSNKFEEKTKGTKDEYNIYKEHIQYVYNYVCLLSKGQDVDHEVLELSALLHDIAVPSEYGDIEEHHIYGEKIAEELLTKLKYPREKIELVKKCVLNHRGSTKLNRESIEEQCVADADVMAHFDCIPDLFSLVYHDKNMNIKDGAEYVKKKLERDFEKLSPATKERLKDRYDTIMKVLFI